ncbi:MAG: hypothetical protein RIT45_2685 [Pseudomonadota bacterium]|jgi:hypothetical protein
MQRGTKNFAAMINGRLPVILPWLAAMLLLLEPGLAILDFHAALLLGPICGWAAGAVVRGALAEGATGRVVAGRLAAVVLLPALELALHGAILPWCAPIDGLLCWALGPVLGAVVGACMAMVASGLSPRRPALTWWLLAVGSALPPLWRFLNEPVVASWHELLGMVPGSLYEDALGPDPRTVWFRAITTPFWLAAAGAAWHLRADRRDRRGWLAVAVAVAALGVGWVAGADQGWRVDRAKVLRDLAVHVPVYADGPDRPPVAMVYLSATPDWQPRAALLAEDVAVAWRELRDFFGRAPTEPVEVFVYLDDRQKRRLMGADAVEMAKPWLGQAHLVSPGFGESILLHEMAHVFGRALSDHPLGVPMRWGVLPDAVRIEGLAVAAEWPTRDGLDPDAESHAMTALGLAPPIERLFSPTGFATESSARAYTLAGSLLRWVWRRCGREALARLYRGESVEQACGDAAAGGIARWKAEVAAGPQPPLSDEELAYERARFETPGLLRRPCPLATGRCAARAAEDRRRGDDAAALRRWRDLRAALRPHLGASSLPLWLDLTLAAAQVRTGEFDAAKATLAARLTASPRALDRAALLSARGDLALHGGDADAARRDWREAGRLPRSEAAERTLLVKDMLVGSEAGRAVARDLLALGGRGDDVRARYRALRQQEPERLVARYLDARVQLLRPEGRAGARDDLRLLAGAATVPRLLRREARRLLALDAARRGECAVIDPLAAAAGDDRRVQAWRTRAQARCRQMRALTTLTRRPER